jgi:hypothetical protein
MSIARGVCVAIAIASLPLASRAFAAKASGTVTARYQISYGGQSLVTGPTTTDLETITGPSTSASESTNGAYAQSGGSGDWSVSAVATPGQLHLTSLLDNTSFPEGSATVISSLGAQSDDTFFAGTSPGQFKIFGVVNGNFTGSTTANNYASWTDSLTFTITLINFTNETVDSETIKSSNGSLIGKSFTDTGAILENTQPGDIVELTASVDIESNVEAFATSDSGFFSNNQATFGDTAYVVIQPQNADSTFTTASGYAYDPVIEAPEPASLAILAWAGLPFVKRRRRWM